MTNIIKITIFILLGGSTSWALDQRLEGVEFVGVDSHSNEVCKVRIDKIKKRILVDDVTITVQVDNDFPPWSVTLGEFDLTSGSYVASQDQDFVSLKVDKSEQSATYSFTHFRRDGMVDLPAFSSYATLTKCEKLKRITNPDLK